MKEWQTKAAFDLLRMIKKSYIENNGLIDCWVHYLKNMSRTMFFYIRSLDADFFNKIGF